MKPIVFILEGLNCANCANKIETEVSHINEVEMASVNFVNKSLTVTSTLSKKDLLQKVSKIVHKHEPHIIVNEKGSSPNKEDKKSLFSNDLFLIIISSLLFLIAFLSKKHSFSTYIYLITYILIGGEILLKAGKNILRKNIFDENFLMSIATLGAIAIGEYPEALAVMLFYRVGEFFQDMAVNSSRKSIKSLLDLKPDYANLKTNTEVKKVSPDEVSIHDEIIVKPGERIPLDGVVVSGTSAVDTSALTGESIPREITVNDEALSGMINTNGLLTLKVTKTFSDSTLSKILDLVENATNKKAPTEQFITKFAKYYTPFVVIAALLLAFLPPLIFNQPFNDWVYRALIFLVISCPCALVVSIPLGFFAGIGSASKNGVLIKGGNYLEALNNVNTVVFDKTGTLTKGKFEVISINPRNHFSEEDLLKYAAYSESFSTHPIALSIISKYNQPIEQNQVLHYEEIAGYGISAQINDKEVRVGNEKLMEKENIQYEKGIHSMGTAIHVSLDATYMGYIIISDTIKSFSKDTIKQLKTLGINRSIMLTGDNERVSKEVASNLGLSEYYAQLLPQDKLSKVEELYETKGKGTLVFVGDGINDSPALARADVGIAMGALGSDAAIEAADVVLMDDNPLKIVTAIKISRKTRTIVIQNIIFALGVKGIFLILGAFGIATMWEAVFADVGVTLIAVMNSMRALKYKS
ncbi:Cd2+/Zn2+-exporting ATPase [Natranaerovirga hydrolytica]|uniref:Cd2+/Zn2+-exporting ATPase n=1 Tax=Natranaerovirga hydrolytica TaxID=680378 RepID=A0A4R1MX85_9FIRM|nr:heavy metal translocating P-type ATPase [Natranaerovirga hydrolytica]TCK97816.1 Cd2+/Zn2+-exporting ATPase [Natranaerovirga hydrolytica]